MEKKTPISIGKRNLDEPSHWQELNLNSYRITKPTIICLGGNCTKTSRDANNICKIAESLIGLKQQKADEEATYNDVDLVGVAYGEIDREMTNDSTVVTKEEVADLVDNLLLPLAVNDNGDKLGLEEAQKNFCNVNFFLHCYGASVLNSMIIDLGRKMLTLGYKSSDILKIESQMTSVSYAPLAEVYNIPSLQVISGRDRTSMVPSGASTEFYNLFYDVFEGKKEFSGNYLFKEDENTVTLFTANMNKISINEHSLNLIERDEFWRSKPFDTDNGDGVSQAVGYTLANAVATGLVNQSSEEFVPKPTSEEIFESCKSILSDFKQCSFQDAEQ